MFNKIKNNPIVYLVTRMWEFGRDRRATIVTTMIGSALAMMTWLTVPLVMAKFINSAQRAASSNELFECAGLLGLSVILGVIAWMFHGPSRVTELLTSVHVRRNMHVALLTKVTRLPMKWHTQHHSGETIDRVAKAGSALSEFADSSFMVVQLLSRLIGAMIMMAFFMPEAALIVGVSIALAVALILAFDRVLVPLYESGNIVLNHVASKVQDYLTNITTVISLRLEGRVVNEINRKIDKFMPITRKTSVLNEVKWFFTNLLVDIVRVVTLFWFVFKAVKSGKVVELGTLVALNEYLTALGNSFFEFTWKWGDFVIKATRLKAIEAIERDYSALVGEVSLERLPKGWKKLQLTGLSFRHEGGDKDGAGVFDVSLLLERGKSYAVVGASGGGKSTLLSLMRGLNKAQAGEVFCDGVKIESGMTAVSHNTTLIPQEPEVFADTVLNNVTMGVETPEEKVLEALAMARFSEVLVDLPKGLATNIAEKGVSLSGGQKQRLALARGLFFALDSDSDIILMDESTSSVDIANEQGIFEVLLERFKHDLILATTHKFNLLPLFDEVIVMRDGRVVEKGPLDTLIANRGVMSEMWDSYSRSAGYRVAGMVAHGYE